MAVLSVTPYADDDPVFRQGWVIGVLPQPTPTDASTTDAPEAQTEKATDDASDEQAEPEPER